MDKFPNPLAELVWRTRYRHAPPGAEGETGPADTQARVARALARGEKDTAGWRRRFAGILADYRFLPGGRILAAAGIGRRPATLLNCFVMGPVRDDPAALFRALAEGARTLRLGGGVGWDFSSLAPQGTPLPGGGLAPGPVACLDLWDAACRVVTAGSVRGGAMMGSLSVAHPDILDFIAAKARAAVLPRFNLSVQLPDAFLAAVAADARWPLGQPESHPAAQLPARMLWNRMLQSMIDWAEPGVLFTDTLNRENNLWWREQLSTTNPCGEAPLPAYGACDLGSINLAALVRQPFTPGAHIDTAELEQVAAVAVRLLDNVLDRTRFPLARQRHEALATRRIGLGVTGLGDALAMLGLRYDSDAGRTAAAGILEQVKLAAYQASCSIAADKGTFAAFDAGRYLSGRFTARLPDGLRREIGRQGIRNSHLLAVAPTGSVSLLAGNVSPGIEPIPALRQRRKLHDTGSVHELEVADRAWSLYRETGAGTGAGAFVEAADVSPEDQLAMLAVLQPHVDGAISKTVLLPADTSVERLGALLERAHHDGLKGFAAYRPGTGRGGVIGPACALDEHGRAQCDPS